VDHSSVYLYDDRVQCAIKSDASWNQTVNNTLVANAVNYLAYLDDDFNEIHTRVNATVQMYVATQVWVGGGKYVSVHRSYPGLPKPCDLCKSSSSPSSPTYTYNPVDRPVRFF
jgi:hypothetical protein